MRQTSVDYSELIKKLRKRHKLTQTELGNILSIGKTTISNYETGYSVPATQTLKRIASEFEEDYINFIESENITDDEVIQKIGQSESKIIIPYFKTGDLYKVFSSEEPDTDLCISLPEEMLTCGSESLMCIKVSDDAMEDDGIRKNDYVIVKKNSKAQNKQRVFVYDADENKYMLRKYILEDHVISLIPSSSSPEYPVIRYDVYDSRYVIVGCVVKALVSFDEM